MEVLCALHINLYNIMKLTYLIFAHDNLLQLEHLLERLQSPNIDFMIHIDSKSTTDFSSLLRFSNVFFVRRCLPIYWGGISMVYALLLACKDTLNFCKGEMVIFLSGTDYPVKSNEYIIDFFRKYKNQNFIQGFKLPNKKDLTWLEGGRRRIECYALRLKDRSIATIEPKKINLDNFRQFLKVLLQNPRKMFKLINILLTYPLRQHPKYLWPYGGEFWWCLPVSSIKTILSFIDEHPDFIDYHKDTANPDELFFNTLIYNLYTKEFIQNDCLRWINWKGKPSPENVSKKDISFINKAIEADNVLFLRKVNDIYTCDLIDSLIKK